MSKIYLINVGANTSHRGTARSPIFEHDTFLYVSFPHAGEPGTRPYPPSARRFIRNVDPLHTHFDPDWENLTYGDYCRNRRAVALRRAEVGDTLLFWSLLWRNTGQRWEDFTGERGWYLIGALRISEILEEGQSPKDAKPSNAKRAAKNAHFCQRILDPDNRVFIGSIRYSTLFPKAVDLEATRTSGLLFETIRTAGGLRLKPHGKRNWYSSTRACRVIWDLDEPEERARTNVARKAILGKTGYDLLRDL
jgi:hypothetical protein